MTKRSVVAVLVLSVVTFGLYTLFWFVKTKEEMNSRGASIPTAWLLLIPFAGIYWMWKWCEGVEIVTRKELSGPVAFLLVWLLSLIGIAIVQSKFNIVADESPMPVARVM